MAGGRVSQDVVAPRLALLQDHQIPPNTYNPNHPKILAIKAAVKDRYWDYYEETSPVLTEIVRPLYDDGFVIMKWDDKADRWVERTYTQARKYVANMFMHRKTREKKTAKKGKAKNGRRLRRSQPLPQPQPRPRRVRAAGAQQAVAQQPSQAVARRTRSQQLQPSGQATVVTNAAAASRDSPVSIDQENQAVVARIIAILDQHGVPSGENNNVEERVRGLFERNNRQSNTGTTASDNDSNDDTRPSASHNNSDNSNPHSASNEGTSDNTEAASAQQYGVYYNDYEVYI
jgi:hypothetical protein